MNSASPQRRITPHAVVVAAPDQISCELAGEAAILNLQSGVYYGLNVVGATVWKLIQAPQPVSAILGALLREYDVDSGQCERDLLALLAQLAAERLIEVRAEPAR